MYSILLIDDEKMELDMLRDYVDWKKAGIGRVYTARGSKSALACISENEPDIILTDIKMPGMTGTELAQLIREEGHNCKIIFLTGYEKFEYAKAAVQVQAEDYLLKPFQVEEVEELAAKVVDKIKRERMAKEAEQLAVGRAIEQACTGQADAADSAFQKKAAGMSFCLLGVCGASAEQRRIIRAMPGVIHGFLLDSLYIVLLSPAVPAQDMAKRMLRQSKRDIRAAVCRESADFYALRERCESLLQCRDALFFGAPKMLLFAEDIPKPPDKNSAEPPGPPQKRDSLLLYAVLDGDESRAVQHLHTILQSFQSGGRDACLQSAYNLYLYLREHLKRDNHDTGGAVLGENAETRILHSHTYIELENVFADYIRACCQVYQEGADRQLVNWVIRYIEDYYAGPCGADEIAEGVNLSPNYVRKRFKASTGRTILEYLTDVRLNRAAELLKTSNMKVKEVSVRVGYENIPYFTQLFSKKFGVTPNEYKKPSEHEQH